MVEGTVERTEWLGPADVARLYPVSVSTVRRWFHYGLRGVRLNRRLIGGRAFTRREWIEEFFRATDAAAGVPQESIAGSAAAKRRAAVVLSDCSRRHPALRAHRG